MGRLGKHPSEETRAKLRLRTGEKNAFYGKHHTEETKEKIRKGNIGREISKETREKMSKSLKGRIKSDLECKHLSEALIGKKRPKETREKIRKTLTGKKASKETCEKLSKVKSGERNPNWKGGASYFPYCQKFDRKRKQAVRNFFNNLCICTGEPQYHRALSVHHIDHDKEQGCNGKPFNLVPMSSHHHSKETYNEEEYRAYINKTLREGFKWGIWNEQEYIEKVMY